MSASGGSVRNGCRRLHLQHGPVCGCLRWDGGDEHIAASGQCADQCVGASAEGASDVSHALDDALVGGSGLRPHHAGDFVMAQQPVRVPGQELQQREGFGTQCDRTVWPEQQAARGVEGEPTKPVVCFRHFISPHAEIWIVSLFMPLSGFFHLHFRRSAAICALIHHNHRPGGGSCRNGRRIGVSNSTRRGRRP